MDEAGQIANAYNHMISSIAQLQQALVQRERARKEAEINALRAQINPHFIYNMLEIFRARMEEAGQGSMARSMTSLGKMLRYSTNWSEKSYLYNELEHLENYIRLQKISMGDRIRYYLQCDERLLRRQVPKMILQPIVENCIIHGLRPERTLTITVTVSLDSRTLRIIIFDDGVGMEKDEMNAIITQMSSASSENEMEKRHRLSHIGLNNINQRIQLEYGDRYGVFLDSTRGLYTRVTILLPDSEGE